MTYHIYGTPTCGYCTRAKDLLTARGLPFVYYDISENLENRTRVLEAVPGMKTVPQIFNDDKYVGGYTELLASFSPSVDINETT